MNSLVENEFNCQLAGACQASKAACCCKGSVFLPEIEYQAIRQWVLKTEPGALPEYEKRSQKYEGFRLYDQQHRCQFLDDKNLCRLHTQGVKPSECFWWPFHVYTAAGGSLEIRLSTSCCDGYKYFTPGLPFLDVIDGQARKIGFDLIRSFRKVYAGSYQATPVRELAP